MGMPMASLEMPPARFSRLRGALEILRLRHTQATVLVDANGQQLREIEAIQVHHLAPGRDEVVDELFLRVGTRIDFSQSAELRV